MTTRRSNSYSIGDRVVVLVSLFDGPPRWRSSLDAFFVKKRDEPSMPSPYRSRVTLLGDAAHAMPTPFKGQGANQALVDAYCLASELKAVGAEHAGIAEALGAYARKRQFATARLLLNSRILGFLETQSGAGAAFRDNFFRVTGESGIAKLVFLDGAIPRGV